jgi:hypothetical protein
MARTENMTVSVMSLIDQRFPFSRAVYVSSIV